MNNLHLVYDFADQLPRVHIMLVPLLFVTIGIGTFIFHKRYVDPNSTSMFGINKRDYGMFFGILFTLISGVMSLFIVPIMVNEYFHTRTIYNNNQYTTIEGRVENYHPMPEGGHDLEKFDVNGIHFEFSDFDLSDYGYNNAASNGGEIKEGLFVRIGYYNKGNKNIILKLETE